ERLAELRLARDVREDAQLDLRVVGRDEAAAALGDERAPDLASEVRADRDRRRERAGRGNRLVEVRVQTSVVADQRWQRAEVGVEQLGQLPPLLDHLD